MKALILFGVLLLIPFVVLFIPTKTADAHDTKCRIVAGLFALCFVILIGYLCVIIARDAGFIGGALFFAVIAIGLIKYFFVFIKK